MQDSLTAIPAATLAFNQAHPNATVAEQAAFANSNKGTSVPNVGTNLPPATTPPPVSTPASAFSSTAGSNALADSQAKAAMLSPSQNLTPAQYTAVTGNAPATPLTQQQLDAQNAAKTASSTSGSGPLDTTPANGGGTVNTVTLVNDQGQEYKLTNPSPEALASFKTNGWNIAEGEGNGAGIIDTPSSSTPNSQIASSQQATTEAKAAIAAATQQLTSFNVSNDPVLQAQLASITNQWNQREAEMTTFNNSRVAATTTLGYRNGMQYTGGTGGAFGSIITSEEQQGVQRIADLETQKQQALSAATIAYQTKEWDQYAKLVDLAETHYQDQVKELNTLQTAAATASKDQQAARQKAQEDYYTEVQKPIDDLVTIAKNNGAPASVIAQAANAPDLSTAYSLLGDYSAGGTGTVGEYNYYKAQATAAGQAPLSFSAYQTVDANRKASAAASAANGTGSVDLTILTPTQQGALKSNGFTGYNGGTQNLAMQLVTGGLAPSELSKRTTGTSSYNDVLTAADAYSMATTGKHFNIAQADRDYKFATRPQTQDTLNYLGSLVGSDDGTGKLSGGNLDELQTLSDGVTRTSFPALNDAAAWARYSTGDPSIAAFQATATEVADQVAKILQGGNSGGTSDAKLQQAANLFNTGFSKAQLSATINALKPLLANRAKNMIKDNAYLSDYADQFGISQIPGTQPTVAQTIIQQQQNDPLNLGPAPGSTSASNPFGI